MNPAITGTYKWCKRIAICVIGGSVLLVGVCMIVLPGPALVVIPLGLGILGLEFAWARRWLRKMKQQAQNYVPGFKPAAKGSTARAAPATTAAAATGKRVEMSPAPQRVSGSTSPRNSSYDRTP